MVKNIKQQKDNLGDEAPTIKDLLTVLIVVATLIGLAWLAYYKLGWLH